MNRWLETLNSKCEISVFLKKLELVVTYHCKVSLTIYYMHLTRSRYIDTTKKKVQNHGQILNFAIKSHSTV